MYMTKKILALVLALLVILTAAALAEETLSPLGDWYAEIGGMPLQLTLTEDGAYTLSFPGLPDTPTQGTWELNDGFIFLDGGRNGPLLLGRGPADPALHGPVLHPGSAQPVRAR